MAAIALLKGLTRIVLSPLTVTAGILMTFDLYRFRSELRRCLEVVDSCNTVPPRYIAALVAAEDHRNAIHPGVDPFAIIRALVVRLARGNVQGASTIEQQLVRAVTKRYERSIRRKVREQLLALALTRRRSKPAIASAYLRIAYFGTGITGIERFAAIYGTTIDTAAPGFELGAVAALKYPRPFAPTSSWNERISHRVRHIVGRLVQLADNTVQPTGLPHDLPAALTHYVPASKKLASNFNRKN